MLTQISSPASHKHQRSREYNSTLQQHSENSKHRTSWHLDQVKKTTSPNGKTAKQGFIGRQLITSSDSTNLKGTKDTGSAAATWVVEHQEKMVSSPRLSNTLKIRNNEQKTSKKHWWEGVKFLVDHLKSPRNPFRTRGLHQASTAKRSRLSRVGLVCGLWGEGELPRQKQKTFTATKKNLTAKETNSKSR